MTAQDVIEQYETVLGGFGRVVDFDVSALDRLGVPVTSCSLLVDGRFAALANGYAANADDARVGGLGELTEGVLMGRAVRELVAASGRRATRRELVAAEGVDRVVDPRTLGLPAGTAYDDERELVWVPTRRVRTGETVWVPADFVVSEPGESDGPTLITPVTNGLGAGLDEDRALNHGIMEILQRHTNGLRFRALDRLSPVIEETGLPAPVRALADAIRDRGVIPVFKHAGTELGVCSTYVMGLDDDDSDPIRITGCGEAAHPSAEVSLTKALLEFANSRARKAFFFGRQPQVRDLGPASYWTAVEAGAGDLGEPRAREAMLAWAGAGVARLRELTAPVRDRSVSYAEIAPATVPDLTRQRDIRDHLLRALGADELEHDVLAVTTTVAGVTAAKVMITNLEVEILSYGRIGESGVRRSLEADLDLVRIQDGPSASHPDRVLLSAEAEDRLGGRAFYSYAAADAVVGDRYPLYREPPRHSVAV